MAEAAEAAVAAATRQLQPEPSPPPTARPRHTTAMGHRPCCLNSDGPSLWLGCAV